MFRTRGESVVRNILHQAKPVLGFQLQADVAARARVVVNRYRNGYAVALRERHGQIEFGEEILEDLDAGSAAAQSAVRRGSDQGHAPRGDGIGHRDGDAGRAVLVGDDFRIDVEGFGEVGAHVGRGGGTHLVHSTANTAARAGANSAPVAGANPATGTLAPN